MDSGRELLDELRIYPRLIGARLRGQMQYKASFALQVAGNFLTLSLELASIFILFSHFDTIGGWRVGDVAFLYGLSAISFGIGSIIAGGFDGFQQQVVRGEFDCVLVRPVSLIVQVLSSDIKTPRIGQIVQGIVAFGIALHLTDVPWTLGRILFLPLVIITAVVLFTTLFTLEATMCFWTTQATEVINAFTYGGSTMAQYPLHVFSEGLRYFFLFVIPIGFVIFLPSLYLLDRPDPLGLPAAARFAGPIATLLFAIVAGWLWRTGVRHYRSTGS